MLSRKLSRVSQLVAVAALAVQLNAVIAAPTAPERFAADHDPASIAALRLEPNPRVKFEVPDAAPAAPPDAGTDRLKRG